MLNPILSSILLVLCSLSSQQSLFQKPQWQLREFHAPEQLPHDVVRDIKQAPDGAIWLATWGGGVASLNNGITTVYNTKDGLLTNDTRKLAIDRFGGIWVCTSEGINYIQSNNEILSFTPVNQPILEDDSFYSVAIDSRGCVWFGSGKEHLYSCELINTNEPFPYGNIKRFPLNLPEEAQGIRDIEIDKNDNIWLAVNSYGIVNINHAGSTNRLPLPNSLKTFPIYNLYPDPDKGIFFGGSYKIFNYYENKTTLYSQNQSIYIISIENINDHLLIGTKHGLYRIDNGQWELIPLSESYPTPTIECISVMNDGSIWLGTHSGAYRLFQPTWHYHTLPSNHNPPKYKSLISMENGSLYVVSDRTHLFKYERNQWKPLADLNNPIDQAGTNDEFNQNNPIIYVKTNQHILKIQDDPTFIIQSIPPPKPVLSYFERGSSHQFRLYHEGENELWLIHEAGASKWNGEAWTDYTFHEKYDTNDSRVYSMLKREDNEYWFGGLNWVEVWKDGNRTALELPQSYRENESHFNDMVEHDGKIYLATDGNGLLIFDQGKWEHMNQNTGFPCEGIGSLYSASDGTLWLGSETSGIISYKDGRWVHYGVQDGIPNGKIDTLLEDGNGTIWASIFYVGLVSFHPEDHSPFVQIDTYSERLIPNERAIFSFSGRDQWHETDSKELVYSWRVVDSDLNQPLSSWSPYSSKNSITTDRMQPGNYRLEVLTQDKSRNISVKPAIAHFSVAPYFWNTPQFYVPVFLSCLVAIVSLSIWYRNHLALQLSEKRYRNLLDKDSATLVLNWDKNGQLIYCNETAERLFHTIQPDFNQRPVHEWITCHEPDSQKAYYDTLQLTLENPETPQGCRLKLNRVDKPKWISWFFRATHAHSDQHLEIHAVGVDISQQVNAESELEQEKISFKEFCDAAQVGIIRFNKHNQIIYMNPAMKQIIEANPSSHTIPPLDEWADIHAWKGFLWLVRDNESPISKTLQGTRRNSKETFYAIVSAVNKHDSVDMMIVEYTEQKLLQEKIALASQYEQEKLGRELHDGLGQLFSAIMFMGMRLQNQLNDYPTEITELISEINQCLYKAKEQTHLVSKGLNPTTLHKLGLKKALEELFESYQQVYPPEIQLDYKDDFTMPHDVQEIVYRIVREAVFNALKHAEANRIDVIFQKDDDHNQIIIQDDGKGMPDQADPEESKGMGWDIMTYQAKRINAEISWVPPSTGGTRVICRFS